MASENPSQDQEEAATEIRDYHSFKLRMYQIINELKDISVKSTREEPEEEDDFEEDSPNTSGVASDFLRKFYMPDSFPGEQLVATLLQAFTVVAMKNTSPPVPRKKKSTLTKQDQERVNTLLADFEEGIKRVRRFVKFAKKFFRMHQRDTDELVRLETRIHDLIQTIYGSISTPQRLQLVITQSCRVMDNMEKLEQCVRTEAQLSITG